VDLPLDYKLKCNISIDVNYLHQGINLGLAESRDMSSEQLGTTVTFKVSRCYQHSSTEADKIAAAKASCCSYSTVCVCDNNNLVLINGEG
jgi:hypothetical protein